jgi:hypothetical protein
MKHNPNMNLVECQFEDKRTGIQGMEDEESLSERRYHTLD